jgi:hypothetical protein
MQLDASLARRSRLRGARFLIATESMNGEKGDRPPPTRTCPQCNKPTDDTTRFCPHCGYQLTPAESSAIAGSSLAAGPTAASASGGMEERPPAEPIEPVTSTPPADRPGTAVPAPEIARPVPPPRRNNSLLPILVGLAVLAALVIVGWLLLVGLPLNGDARVPLRTIDRIEEGGPAPITPTVIGGEPPPAAPPPQPTLREIEPPPAEPQPLPLEPAPQPVQPAPVQPAPVAPPPAAPAPAPPPAAPPQPVPQEPQPMPMPPPTTTLEPAPPPQPTDPPGH